MEGKYNEEKLSEIVGLLTANAEEIYAYEKKGNHSLFDWLLRTILFFSGPVG